MTSTPREDSDQPGCMIRILAGRTGHLFGFVMLRLILKSCEIISNIFSALSYSKNLPTIKPFLSFDLCRVIKVENTERGVNTKESILLEQAISCIHCLHTDRYANLSYLNSCTDQSSDI